MVQEIDDFPQDCSGTRYGHRRRELTAIVCFSFDLFFFLDLESQPLITVMFFAFLIDAERVLR